MVYKKYMYDGPVYYYGNKIGNISNMYTMAKSVKEAANNFLFRVANGDNIMRYDIVMDNVYEIIDTSQATIVTPVCDICGYPLTTMGECPVCDFGEYDLLDDYVDQA